MPKVFHAFTSSESDSANAGLVRPSNWNAAFKYGNAAGSAPSGTDALIREQLTADRTYYVRTDGSDSNTGLVDSAGGAFLTIQKAVDTFYSLDPATFVVTISIGAGTFNESVRISGPMWSERLVLIGASSTTTIINATGPALLVQNSAAISVEAMKLQATTYGIWAITNGLVVFNDINFGACTSAHINAETGAYVESDNNYAISGAAAEHYKLQYQGRIRMQNMTVTISGTPAFTQFANCIRSSFLRASGQTFSGSATGARYSVDLNSVILVNGGGANYFPGDAAGSSATGGQYA